MEAPRPLDLLLAAGPRSPGADALLDRVGDAARAGTAVRVLLTGDGLAFAGDVRLAAGSGVRTAACSRSARDRRLDPTTFPPGLRWSSLTAWFAEAAPGARTWAAFP